MKNCPNCRASCAEDARFCSQCGTSFINTCPNCQKEIPFTALFCSFCGSKIRMSDTAIMTSIENPKVERGNRFVLGVLAFSAAVTIFTIGLYKEGWYLEDILPYFIGSLLLSYVGLLLLIKNFLYNKKAVSCTLLATSLILLLFGIILEEETRGRWFDWDNVLPFFWVSLPFSTIAIILFFKNTKSEKLKSHIIEENEPLLLEAELTLPQNEGLMEVTDDKKSVTSNVVKEEKALKVHWNTVIDGKPFRYATYVSYIGLPLSLLINFVTLIYQFSYPSIMVLFSVIMLILMYVAVTGLYEFKRYAYMFLLAINYIGIATTVIIILYVSSTIGLNGIVLSGFLIGVSPSIASIVYFRKRSSAYCH